MTKPSSPFRYFNSSPQVIRLVVMMYVKFPLSLRNVEDLLAERGIDLSYETVRYWWNRFGPMVGAETSSTRSATSSIDKSTSGHARKPSPSGNQSWDKPRLGLGDVRHTGDELPLV